MVPSREEDVGRWRALLGSERMVNWMAEICKSSSLNAKPRDWEEWEGLMLFFQHGDVSGIEHLQLQIDQYMKVKEVDGREESNDFGFVLRAGRFSGLKSLMIICYSGHYMDLGLGSASLAAALRTGHYTNLRELHFEVYDESDFNDILEALVEGSVPQLTSLSVMSTAAGPSADQKFDALLKSQYLRNLTNLDLTIAGGHLRQPSLGGICVNGIKSGLLPDVRSLTLAGVSFREVDLSGLVGAPGNWFSSLKHLNLWGCSISARQVSAMVKAIVNLPDSELALEFLYLGNNDLDDSAIKALAALVESGRLPQLRRLNLSWCQRIKSGGAFARLMGSIQRGRLPRLEYLNFKANPIGRGDEGAEAVVGAYFENEALTAEIWISWDSVSDPSLKAKANKLRERNKRLAALRDEGDGDQFKVLSPLTSAKVFLCGFPEVGKTTLRKSMGKDLGLFAKLKWETRPKFFKEPRTKGIELLHIEDQTDIKLTLWDLAGQEEFHVLHGTFFSDLGFAGGKATTFVLVFRIPAPKEEDVEAKLLYWLKFVASSSYKLVRRQVVIVLNCFYGNECNDSDKTYWKDLIQKYAEKFDDILQIHRELVIIDARVSRSVQVLKNHLFSQAGILLQDVNVPKACFEILKDLKQLSQGGNKSRLPIFTWKAFEEGWKLKHVSDHDHSRDLKVCASYLHEMGEIIYLDEQESTLPQSGNKRIVVPDPEWFCRQVVGQLLVPKGMLEGDRSIQVSADGTISPLKFGAFFKHLLPAGTETDDVISMLQQVGLCYMEGLEKIVIPALIAKDDYATLDWEGQGLHGVVGRCLAVEDIDRCAIPGTLFRRLQVELAKDSNLGGRGDSGYTVGKSFSTFKRGDLLIMVQFDVDHSDPSDDRIDIIVKSTLRTDSSDVRLAKVDCISEIMQMLERLCVTCCPGLRYAIKVIQPWNAKEKTVTMTKRRVMSLTEIKSLLVKGQDYLGWNLNGDPLEIKTLLSKNEMEGVVGMAQHEYENHKHEAVSLGLLTENSLQTLEEFEKENYANAQSVDMERASGENQIDDGADVVTCKILNKMDEHHHVTLKAIHEEGHLTRQYIEKSHQVLLLEIQSKHYALARCIQAQQEFSIEEQERSVPRYIFLSRKQGNLQGLKEFFKQRFELHLLCESHFDDGLLHEVEGQEGVQLTKPKEWLVKISPWLRRTVQVAVMLGKTVGNIYLPGVFNFIPDLNYLENNGEGTSKTVNAAATMMLEEHEGLNQVQHNHRNYGTAAAPIDLNERNIAEGVVKDLREELGEAFFNKKIGLIKVLLKATTQPPVGSSIQAESSKALSVMWICQSCYQNYGDRARKIG